MAKSWTRVTEAFGEVQDSAVACELLAGIAHQAAGAVATGSFEVLIAQERARASEARNVSPPLRVLALRRSRALSWSRTWNSSSANSSV